MVCIHSIEVTHNFTLIGHFYVTNNPIIIKLHFCKNKVFTSKKIFQYIKYLVLLDSHIESKNKVYFS